MPAIPDPASPVAGTVPLGPDEPELFTAAMERILVHLAEPADGRAPARLS